MGDLITVDSCATGAAIGASEGQLTPTEYLCKHLEGEVLRPPGELAEFEKLRREVWRLCKGE